MLLTRIMATTDGTGSSLRAVEAAAQLVAHYQAEFVVVTAVSVPQHVAMAANMDRQTVDSYVELMAQESLGPAVELLRKMGVGAEIKAIVGAAPETILAEIEATRVDLVVMGRGTRYQPKDLILGSVSYRVARRVKAPILLVP